MSELSAFEFVTEPVRLQFPDLFKPAPTMRGGDKLAYQATLLIPPDADIQPYRDIVKAAMIEQWGKPRKLTGRSMPIGKCADKSHLAGFEDGWFFCNTKSGPDYPVQVVDQNMDPILDQAHFARDPEGAIRAAKARIFAGCWVRAHISAWCWTHDTGKGVSFNLNSVQLIRTGDPLGGGRSVTEVFQAVDVAELGMDDDSAADLDDEIGF